MLCVAECYASVLSQVVPGSDSKHFLYGVFCGRGNRDTHTLGALPRHFTEKMHCCFGGNQLSGQRNLSFADVDDQIDPEPSPSLRYKSGRETRQ